MAEIGEMVEAGVRMFSDDGRCVPDARVLRNALDVRAGVRGRGARRALRGRVARRGRADARGRPLDALGLAGQPREAEEIIVARDLAIARLTGGRLHLCHLLRAGSVELRPAREGATGVRVTAEVTPHHLVFSDEDLVTYDTNFKVNPPLRARRGPRGAPGGAGRRRRSTSSRRTTRRTRSRRRRRSSTRRRPGTIGLETALAAVLTAPRRARHRCSLGARDRGDVHDPGADPRRRATTAGRSSPGVPRTSSCSTRPPSGSSSRRSPRGAATARSSAGRSAAASSTPSSAASSSSPTGRRQR